MYTNDQIANLSSKDLVNAYNELATLAQRTHVTRFATRVDGIRRTTNLAEQVHAAQAVIPINFDSFSRPSNNPTDTLADEPSNVVQLEPTRAEKWREHRAAVKAAREKVTALKTTAQPKAAKLLRVTVSSRCRELLATHTNEEIFAILQEEFGVDEKKRGYPAWYRADAKRKEK